MSHLFPARISGGQVPDPPFPPRKTRTTDKRANRTIETAPSKPVPFICCATLTRKHISATHWRAGGVYREKMVTWCWGSAPKSLEPSAAAPDYAGSPWLSVACEQAGEECDMIWGAQGGGSVRNMRGMDEDDYYAATARIPDILTT